MAGFLRLRNQLGAGTGGSSDTFDGTLKRDSTHGVEPSTVKVYSENTFRGVYGAGTLIAQDDGAGNIVAEAGHYLAASTINYTTGVIHVEEDGTHNEFNSTWCCVDYDSLAAAPTEWETLKFRGSSASLVPEYCTRSLHSDVFPELTKHGSHLLERVRYPGSNYTTGEIFLQQDAAWNTADDVSIAMLYYRDWLGGSLEGPHQFLVARFESTYAYAVGYIGGFGGGLILSSGPYGNNGFAGVSVYKVAPVSLQSEWNGLRLDVQTVGSDVRLEVFGVYGSTECDRDSNLFSLDWESQFAVWHRNGVLTPEIISGAPITNNWAQATPLLTGKVGFQFGGIVTGTTPTLPDKAYISSFQARKI